LSCCAEGFARDANQTRFGRPQRHAHTAQLILRRVAKRRTAHNLHARTRHKAKRHDPPSRGSITFQTGYTRWFARLQFRKCRQIWHLCSIDGDNHAAQPK
jgi:hypothetical protein